MLPLAFTCFFAAAVVVGKLMLAWLILHHMTERAVQSLQEQHYQRPDLLSQVKYIKSSRTYRLDRVDSLMHRQTGKGRTDLTYGSLRLTKTHCYAAVSS